MLLYQPASVTGVGRTDAEVHAYSMMAYADIPIPYPSLARIRRGLCGALRGSISVHSVTPVTPTTHTRFDVISRGYHYYISAYSNPFWGDYRWEQRTFPDMELTNEACRHFIGEHDFIFFSKLHTQTKYDRYTVYTARWEQVKMPGLWDAMRYGVRTNHFPHGMVCTMVGTLLEVGYGRRAPDPITELTQREDRTLVGSATPTRMLFPVETICPDSIYSPDPQ